jgi:O-antigen/teichoic acid export membrane protein
VRLAVVSCAAAITIPVALHVLGTSDYGIFSVIGGCLSFLLFINGALIAGAQRHIAHAIGENNIERVHKIFRASVIVHLALSALIALAALCLAHTVVYRLLSLPPARISAALWLYRMVIVVIAANIVSAPYQALLLAHESIIPLSAINIGSATVFLIGVLSLRVIPGDHLLVYGIIYVLSQIILYLGPIVYCIARYRMCRVYSASVTSHEVRELVSFSGWILFGALASVVRAQGPAIVFNMLKGTVVNAAYGLALQVNNFAVNVGSGISRATTSPIIKRQASEDAGAMERLSNLTSVSSFAALWIMLGSFIFNAQSYLTVWLHRIPDDTAIFAIILLLSTLIDHLTCGFIITVQAVGRIAVYQIVLGGANLLVVPLVYVLLKHGYSSASSLAASIACVTVAGIVRVFFAALLAKVSVRRWFERVVVPALLCVCAAGGAYPAFLYLIHPGLVRAGSFFLMNACLTMGVLWKFGFSYQQRSVCRKLIAENGAVRLCSRRGRLGEQGAR